MSEKRSGKLWVIAIAAVALGALAAAALEGQMAVEKAKPEKLCPITFHLNPVTTLQTRFSADIEKTNAKLAQTLVDMRKCLATADTKDDEELLAECKIGYAGTYLANPVLWDESGKPHQGWPEILKHFATIMPRATFIHPQAVNVYLEYLPLANQTPEYLMKRLGTSRLWFEPQEVDFLADIRTVVAYAPFDDPLAMGNAVPIPHKKICDPIY